MKSLVKHFICISSAETQSRYQIATCLTETQKAENQSAHLLRCVIEFNSICENISRFERFHQTVVRRQCTSMDTADLYF